MPNRLTFVYFKNYYKEENYLTVKTIFKYITSPYSNGLCVLTFLYILYTESDMSGTQIRLVCSL